MSRDELRLVIVIALGSFMAGLDGTIVNIALPSIAQYFEISTVLVSWVLTAYLIILVSLLLAASRLGDMKGYRNVFLGGFLLFTIGSVLCAFSTSIEFLLLSRMVQAIGAAGISAVGAAMVTTALPPSLRGQALGIVAMFAMLGAALGPVAGGFLTSILSWQYIFFVNLPVGMAAIILGMRIIPHIPPAAPDSRIDTLGVLLIFVALGSLIIGLTSIQGHAPILGALALLISAIFWTLFIIQERRFAEPLINLRLFSNRAYSLQNLNIMLIQMTIAGVMVIMPFYLEIVQKIPTDNAGTILLALPIGMILTAPLAGKVSDTIGTKKPIITGFILAAAALFLLSTISAQTGIGHIAIYLFLLGAGTGVAFSPLSSAVMGECEAEDRGSTSGLVRVMSNLGSSLGVAMVMLVATIAAGPKLAQYSAHLIDGAELESAFRAAFLFCMTLAILGLLLMFAVRGREPAGDLEYGEGIW
ncbi:multidrug MFS transporter [Methanocalculus chunghsingensis]|uniref:Multidrug MFS transporter n=1 Tax=Methanocalculus chunghsingensis TaxID=156457 RepID=A0A8J7W7T7_9EURY|nr:DHA2 family efflux MFS transporter permease subunit [Methanocalculus chunghsingensis]MBR1369989.1 multidrug MFS transporter [Methanocalculus chunghsingensis]